MLVFRQVYILVYSYINHAFRRNEETAIKEDKKALQQNSVAFHGKQKDKYEPTLLDSILTVHYWWTSRKMNIKRAMCFNNYQNHGVSGCFSHRQSKDTTTFRNRANGVMTTVFGPGVSFRHSKQTEKHGNTHLDVTAPARKLNL